MRNCAVCVFAFYLGRLVFWVFGLFCRLAMEGLSLSIELMMVIAAML
jgi:hypothetical protein